MTKHDDRAENDFQGVRIYDSPALILGATAKGSAQMHGLVRFFINPAELSEFYVSDSSGKISA